MVKLYNVTSSVYTCVELRPLSGSDACELSVGKIIVMVGFNWNAISCVAG